MRKKTKFKSPVLDVFMVVLCLSIAGHFGYSFWKDLNSSSRRTDKEKIATITFKNRIAQRKYEDRVVWERIDKSTPLYNGDLIRTAELAEAVITFNDGSEVDIYENTMIQVYYSENEGIQIDVGNGNLQLASAEKSKVSLILDDGSKISAGGGTSLAAKAGGKSNGARTVEVKNGSAQITANTGKEETLEAGEAVSVKASGEISKKPVTVTSIPQELRVLNVEGDTVPVKIEWKKKDKSKPVVIQTSTKKDFSDIKEEITVNNVSDSVLDLKDGVVYWRIYPEGQLEEASVGKISVESAEPVKLISPSENGNLSYRNRNPSVNFRWNGNDYAKNYLLTVSQTPDMNNPVIQMAVDNSSVELDSLGSGQWWWQVTPYYEINSLGYTGSSAVASFRIEKNEAINPPSLAVPLSDAEIFYKDTLDLSFIWNSEIKANYELIVSANEDFSDILYRKKTAALKASVKLNPPAEEHGTYYWKVIRYSSETDDLNPESIVRSFTVSKYQNVPTKLLYPPEEFSTEQSKLNSTQFVWKPSDEAKGKEAVIQFSKTQDFSDVKVEEKVTGNTFENSKLTYGDWYWRVGTPDIDGSTDFTQPHHIVVQKELTAPEVRNIEEKAEVVIAPASPVVLKWTPVSGADYYNVRIFDSDNKLVAENPEASGSSASFNLPDDNYTLRIQAVASQTEISALRTGPVETIDFSVRTPTPLVALTPANNQKIDGLGALRSPVNFTWKNGSDAPVNAELVLKKRQSDGTLKVVEKTKVTKSSLSLERLTTGSYTWQIVASSKDGIPLNTEPRSFTITPVIQLASPNLQNPSKAFVMDAKFLRKNRSISFEWKAVPEATEYSFILYRKERNGSLVPVYSEKNIKGTKVRFKKLSSLDVGEFEWYVTAYGFAKDGFEERRSEPAKANFTIKFEAPKKIQTEKTGRLYSE